MNRYSSANDQLSLLYTGEIVPSNEFYDMMPSMWDEKIEFDHSGKVAKPQL